MMVAKSNGTTRHRKGGSPVIGAPDVKSDDANTTLWFAHPRGEEFKSIYIYANRWFDARAFAFTILKVEQVHCAQASEPLSPTLFWEKRVFRLVWRGRGGSQNDPLRLKIIVCEEPAA